VILKFEFHAHSPAISQYPDASLAFLSVDPNVATQFRGGCGQRRHGKLVEPKLFRKFSNLLAYRNDIRFFVDAEFPRL
jgi:hypothetical protein